jgi:hypothetical protein
LLPKKLKKSPRLYRNSSALFPRRLFYRSSFLNSIRKASPKILGKILITTPIQSTMSGDRFHSTLRELELTALDQRLAAETARQSTWEEHAGRERAWQQQMTTRFGPAASQSGGDWASLQESHALLDQMKQNIQRESGPIDASPDAGSVDSNSLSLLRRKWEETFDRQPPKGRLPEPRAGPSGFATAPLNYPTARSVLGQIDAIEQQALLGKLNLQGLEKLTQELPHKQQPEALVESQGLVQQVQELQRLVGLIVKDPKLVAELEHPMTTMSEIDKLKLW